jgi:hypothetical protein
MMASIRNLSILFLLLMAFSCKKEKEKEPAPTPAPATPPPPARSNTMTATINGTTWAVKDNSSSNASISIDKMNTTPYKTYVVTGRTQEFNRHAIYIGFPYGVGTRTIDMSGDCYGAYDDPDGTGYFAKTGTINITVFDTSHKKSSVCDKFQATFSFTTVNIGHTYTVENGVIDYEAK